MNFYSPFFIACFLPVSLLIYLPLRNKKAGNVLLLVLGLLFYSFGSLSGLVLLLAAAVVNYLFGLWIMSGRGAKAACVIAVAADLSFLGAYKYLDFLLGSLSGLFGSSWENLGLAAPIGISFFTFKCISYIIDTYRKPGEGTKSFFSLLLYISFFPQLMAGPISRYSDFAPQLQSRRCSSRDVALGLRRFIVGLAKKLILAAAASRVTDAVFALETGSLDIRLAWLGAVAYSLQIYFDFSGYSDMAIGLGRMFGFATNENFDHPYVAESITDFWRRWHISLSGWFKDYLYIPLGGNRKGKARAALNKFIVFALCGLWHGAAWTFVLWGAWHGVFSALESMRVINIKRLRANAAGRVCSHVYTLLVVCVGFVMFRAADFAEGWRIISAMFGAFPVTDAATVALHRIMSVENICVLILCVLLSMPVAQRIEAFCQAKGRGQALELTSFVLSAALLALCLTELASGGFTPFIYFQF